MELLGTRPAVHREGHGDHLRLTPIAAQDAGVAVLHECSDSFRGVHDLERIQRRRQSGQHCGLGHGQVNHAVLQQGMAAGQQTIGVGVGNRAGGRDIHVTAYQHCAYG